MKKNLLCSILCLITSFVFLFLFSMYLRITLQNNFPIDILILSVVTAISAIFNFIVFIIEAKPVIKKIKLYLAKTEEERNHIKTERKRAKLQKQLDELNEQE